MLPLLLSLMVQAQAKPYISCELVINASITRKKIDSPNIKKTEEMNAIIRGYMVESQYGDGPVTFTFVSDMKQKPILNYKSCTFGRLPNDGVNVFVSSKLMEIKNFTFYSPIRLQPITATGGEFSVIGEAFESPTCPTSAGPAAKGTPSGSQSQFFYDFSEAEGKAVPAPVLAFDANTLWTLRNAGAPYTCNGRMLLNQKKAGTAYTGIVEVKFHLDPTKRVSSF